MPPSLRILETGQHLNPIRDAARSVDFNVVGSTVKDWNILWSFRTPWDSPVFKERVRKNWSRPPTLINHFPGTLKLASKAHLPAFARDAGLHNDTPVSYLLPEQLDELSQVLKTAPLTDPAGLPLWLFKSKQHRGVRVLVNRSRASLAANAPAIVQRRVRPLILRGLGRMFDIGLYVLVSQIKPWRAYAFDRALVRVSEMPFPRTHAEFLAKPASYVIKQYSPIWTLKYFSAHLKACGNSAACALRRELSAQGYDAKRLWSRMEGIAASLLHELVPSVDSALQRHHVDPAEAFELFRFDFLVDERARPILTEVNLSPNMVAAHPEDGAVKRALLRELLKIVSVRLPKQLGLSGLLRRPAKTELTDRQVLAAEEAIAETGGWRPINPWYHCRTPKQCGQRTYVDATSPPESRAR